MSNFLKIEDADFNNQRLHRLESEKNNKMIEVDYCY